MITNYSRQPPELIAKKPKSQKARDSPHCWPEKVRDISRFLNWSSFGRFCQKCVLFLKVRDISRF
jgi:hypothetical protein